MHSRIGAAIVAFTVIIFAGCSGTSQSNLTPAPGGGAGMPPSAVSWASANKPSLTQESVIYTFQGGSDGGNPFAGLLARSRELYGTTFSGGTGPSGGNGTVFKLSPSGTKSILYTFQGGTDAANPQAGLIRKNGVLYGDTDYGGGATQCTGGCGAVFALTPSGSAYTERVIYAFQGGSDGASPVGGLLSDASGALYGTTVDGGGATACTGLTPGCGTVFKLTPSGSNYTETVLHSFQGGSDGAGPRGTLIADNTGALYGTTYYGGSGTCSDPSGFTGCGTAFKLTPSGSGYIESVIYNFQGGTNDGANPRSALLRKNGALYGATTHGGAHGAGTVFELTGSSYTERVLYSFLGGRDGRSPSDEDGLRADSNGALYGTTTFGGVAVCVAGCGTVFKLTPSGSNYTETVLHRFQGPGDGKNPRGSVTAGVAGALYGTTSGGANHACSGGCGTVFKVAP